MGCYFERSGKTSSDEVNTKLRPGGCEEGCQAESLGKSISGRRNSKGKGFELGTYVKQ